MTRFGFIGTEPEWQVVQAAFGPDSPDQIAAIVLEPDGTTNPIRPGVPGTAELPRTARRLRDFDALAVDDAIDAVILGGDFKTRASRLKQLIQVGRNCICLHPADSSPLVYHEVAMAASDQQLVVMPWLAGRVQPAWCELTNRAAIDRVGPIRLITVDRAAPVDREQLLLAGHYSETIDLVCLVAGDVTELSCTGDLSAGRLVVQHRMATGGAAEIRLRPGQTRDSWNVQVEGERGRIQLILESGLAGPATLRQPDATEQSDVNYPPPALARLVLDEFRLAVARRPQRISWIHATRAVELGDWARYSLERRRSVDIFREERGELSSFKGRMTSLGCGLIWFTLFALIVIAAGKGLEVPGMDLLAIVLAAVWVLFLILQALRWSVPNGPRQAYKSGSDSASDLR